jgi:hypothetical protein
MAEPNMNYGSKRANMGWWVVAAVAIVGIILAFWGGAQRKQHNAAGRRPSIDYTRPADRGDRGTFDRGVNAPSPTAPVDEPSRVPPSNDLPPPSDQPTSPSGTPSQQNP